MSPRSTATRGSSRSGGTKALDKLGGSIDAAQEALKDLRRELSKGGKEAVKDLEVLLRDARKNLRSTQRTLIKDLEEVQQAAKAKSSRSTASRSSGSRSTASRSSSSSRSRSSSARKTTRKS